jgi:hypothetical protein
MIGQEHHYKKVIFFKKDSRNDEMLLSRFDVAVSDRYDD